ncbi:MAG: hypothetical protein WAZ45_03150, partial [Gemmiger qucibialis]
ISLLQGDLRTKREGTLLQFHYTICLHQTQETLYLCDFFVKHVKNPASAPSLPGFGMVTKIFPLLLPRTALTKPPAWRIVKDRICKLYAHCPALCSNAVRVPPAAPA